jgi:Sulfotransferase family
MHPRPLPLSPWSANGHMIFGPRKSGTTLLESLVDGTGEALVWPGEFKLWRLAKAPTPRQPVYLDDYRRLMARHREMTLPPDNLLDNLQPGDVPDLKDVIRADIESVYSALNNASGPSPQSWVFKEAGGRPAILFPYFFSLFPKGRIVVIVREPLDIIRSLVKFRERANHGIKLRAEMMDPLLIFHELIGFIGHPAVHFVLYEDLTGGTLETSMRAVAAHLGIAFSDVMTRTTQFGEPVVVDTSTRPVAHVFSNDRPWTEGLTLGQIARIGLYNSALRIAGLFGVLPVSSYDHLKDRIQAHQATA